MRKIYAKKITNDNFQAFGEFYDIINPKGNHLDDFYPDHVLAANGSSMPMAFSSYVVRKMPDMMITRAEYHDEACELMLPLDGDIIFHAAPPSKEPVPEQTEAFFVPGGTLVKLNAGVWHQESFAVCAEQVHVLIALPQRTYKRDCVLVPYEEADWMEIVWEQKECGNPELTTHF